MEAGKPSSGTASRGFASGWWSVARARGTGGLVGFFQPAASSCTL